MIHEQIRIVSCPTCKEVFLPLDGDPKLPISECRSVFHTSNGLYGNPRCACPNGPNIVYGRNVTPDVDIVPWWGVR